MVIVIDDKKYWKFVSSPLGNPSPKEYIDSNFSGNDRANLIHKLHTLEKIPSPTNFPNTKSFRHKGILLIQFTYSKYRLYLHSDTTNKPQKLVLCYVCKKTTREAKRKDKDKAASNIQNYMNRYEKR